ncbi:type II toxin-antitoxin system RelE/ParE family toxin [Methylocystis sp. JAN1]|uniref:type II toxin-antitoxin system RelE/ParE family toxin n=1 Tax=Methylocystis sp. JAN1 TaxID=3397211 RepID=UPI003FA2FB2C
MAHILVSSAADADAAAIIADLGSKAGATIAARYDADFDGLYQRLSEYPESGAPRPVLGPAVRVCVISPYVVIYQHAPRENAVIILRIVHGRRDINRKLLGA